LTSARSRLRLFCCQLLPAPRSTLFPYTTLFRSQMNGGPTPTHALLRGSPAIDQGRSFGLRKDQRGHPRPHDYSSVPNASGGDGRSEEHTSELQSLAYLVCRLLLEKKKSTMTSKS